MTGRIMRSKHTRHEFSGFPVYSSAFLSPTTLVLGGGGGASLSGIKNKVRLYEVGNSRQIILKDEYGLAEGEDAPMSMIAHPKSNTFVCGINSVQEKIRKGENENCRSFSVKEDKLKLLLTKSTMATNDVEEYQKVTSISPDGYFLAVASEHDVSLLSYPSLIPFAHAIHTEDEIYDVTFSQSLLVVATTRNLFVYKLDEDKKTLDSLPSKGKEKQDGQHAQSQKLAVPSLSRVKTIDIPSFAGPGSKFRAARFDPSNGNLLFAAINTSPPRMSKIKSTSRQSMVCRWNTETWTLERTKRISDRLLTAFDISADGRLLGFGTSDLGVSLWDSTYFTPLLNILKAHELPVTTVKFNTIGTLLVSGSADNSIRIADVHVGPTSWTFTILLLSLVISTLSALLIYYL